MNEAIPVVDVMGNSGSGGGWGFGEGGWIFAFLIIAVIFGWGRNGCGGGSGDSGGLTTVLPYMMNGGGTAIADGFAMNNLQSGINAIQQGICDATYALNNGLNNGFSNVQLGLCQQGHNMSMGFANVQAALADCCCTTQRAIDGVNFNMATQTNALQQTMCNNTRDIIDSQNAGTRAILDFLTQDKISALTAENQTLKFAASQQAQNAFITANQEAQTAELIRRLGRDCPVPAYVVPNPNCCYGNPVGVSYGQQSCGGCC